MSSAKRNNFYIIQFIIILLVGGFFLFPLQLQAQMLIVGSPQEDILRIAQLTGLNQPMVSMAVSPVE